MKSWTFRLYPEPGSRLFVRAIVFDRRRDMLAFWRECDDRPGRARANCAELHVRVACKPGSSRRDRLSPLIARVCLWRGEMGADTITHEFQHAAFAWARRRNLVFGTEDVVGDSAVSQNHPEERIAWALGELTHQFVARASKAGLYK